SIGHFFRFYYHTQLTTCLYCICLFYACISHSKCFKVFNTLQVALHHLPPCTRASTAYRITSLNNRRYDVRHFHFIVVRTYCVNYSSVFTTLLCHLST